MYPASSSVRTRRRQGGGEMPTRLANSTLVIRPSAWISLRILRSISSRFFDTKPAFQDCDFACWAVVILAVTVLAQLGLVEQFYCACSALISPFTGNFADLDCN